MCKCNATAPTTPATPSTTTATTATATTTAAETIAPAARHAGRYATAETFIFARHQRIVYGEVLTNSRYQKLNPNLNASPESKK